MACPHIHTHHLNGYTALIAAQVELAYCGRTNVPLRDSPLRQGSGITYAAIELGCDW